METPLFDKAIDIWYKAVAGPTAGQLDYGADLYKKLLKFSQVGDYFYWVFNMANYTLEVSENVQHILGYQPAEFTIERLVESIHPDDHSWFLNFENKVTEFLTTLPVEKLTKYKVRYDFRLKKKGGGYVRLLHQSIVIQHDENGKVLLTHGLETDITHLKPEGRPVLSIIGLDGEPSYINIDVEKVFAVSKEFLSKREKQILLLIMEGRLSKEISELLHISKQTVDTHRNNMLVKNNLKNTSELITKAIRSGWV